MADGRRLNGNSYRSARAAGLRYVRDDTPGIRRERRGSAFRYRHPDGRPVRDRRTLGRIQALAVPPAWNAVWICPRDDGHLQATGRDARRRKQYRYHSRWREVRDETKYGRMVPFARALPRLRRRLERDLALPGLPREKVLATVVRLLETTLIRVGNEEYARENESFGLTTLRERQVRVRGGKLSFRFRGKSGVEHTIELTDRRLAAIMRRVQDLPGEELFRYVDDEGETRRIESSDVQAPGSQAEGRRNIATAIEAVAKLLGNTRAVCRKCYVHPAIVESYLEGKLGERLRGTSEEKAIVALLEAHMKQEHASGERHLTRLLARSLRTARRSHRDGQPVMRAAP